jgi:hypothetical protein
MNTRDPTSERSVLVLSPDDNVAVAIRDLTAGEQVSVGETTFAAASDVPLGHKVALASLHTGDKIIKYGAPIGSATRDISAGEHVHTHNMKSDYIPTFTLDGANPYLKGQE